MAFCGKGGVSDRRLYRTGYALSILATRVKSGNHEGVADV
jgi:hypothetical protein